MSACLSVVIPCYNEASTIAAVVQRVLDSPFTEQVIVVDDASSDGSADIVASLADRRVEVIRFTVNRGKGAALRAGLRRASSRFVIIQDADLEYDPADYPAVLEPLLDERADVVFGSRFAQGGPRRVLYFWHYIGNQFLTLLSNMFTNLNLTDMETCYKAFRREVLDDLVLEEDRFGFEPEFTAKVAARGWRVYEVGISYTGRTYAEGKKIGWRDGFEALRCIVKYSKPIERYRLSAARPRVAAGFDDADEELSAVLHSLRGADNYADWIASLLEPYLGDDVLEIGAGHGDITERLAVGRRIVATDLSPRCVDELTAKFEGSSTISVALADVETAAAMGEHDSVVMINVLEHIDDDAQALKHLARSVRPGGYVLVFVPALGRLYSDFDRRIGHVRRYSSLHLRRAMTDAGLDVEELRFVNSVGALAWWVVAKRLRRVPTASGQVRVYDRLFVPVLRAAERRVRPPIGQSLFCAARRPIEDAELTRIA